MADRLADSAGQPWAGRRFPHHPTPFGDDAGEAPEALVAAIGALARGVALLRQRATRGRGDYTDAGE